ncbi:hypothetical protein ARMSODRAFT_1025876 [Armillaria solidipes]|uniref:Uncharacterized protein n=1 Tax=Armillaria solidipes TaxID=1076256 RepID=A0A2H3B980_9AGAR|nr:hypothetical protein ARMSODRAFT_1025876 [Armillaria solidipes]
MVVISETSLTGNVPPTTPLSLNLTPLLLTRFVTTPSDFDPATSALSEAQNSTISYRFIHEIRYLVIYKTMFEYSKDPKIWQLQHDEWAECTEESGSVSLRCLGCSAFVMFDAWEAHRDACQGIEDKMVRAVMADMVSEQPEDEDHRQCWRIRSLRGSPAAGEGDVEIQDDEFVEAHESKRKSLGMRLCSALVH